MHRTTVRFTAFLAVVSIVCQTPADLLAAPARFNISHIPRASQVGNLIVAPCTLGTRHAAAVVASPPPAGSYIVGPSMLSAPTSGMAPRKNSAVTVVAPRRPTLRGARPQPASSENAPSHGLVVTSSPPSTGFYAWWAYHGAAIGGVGHYSINAGNGNLLIQSNDMLRVNDRGLPIMFQRVYNSMSGHDYSGSDGSMPSNFGNGWTNSFDSHIATNDQGGITVFDSDGARYDYLFNPATSTYTAPSGVHAQLLYDGANGYFWVQPNGTVYYYYSPTIPSAYSGIAGRLFKIWGRNENVWLQLSYSFDGGDASSYTKLNQITAASEDGKRTVVLSFKNFAGRRLLHSLQWPDGTTVSYKYDGSGNLYTVNQPGNNVSGTLSQWYEYATANGTNQVTVSTPRWAFSGGTDGAQYCFAWNSTSRQLQSVTATGNINPTITDASGTGPIQPNAPLQGVVAYRQETLQYNVAGLGCTSNGNTVWSDTDGHQITYCFDSAFRLVQLIQTASGSSSVSNFQTWDVNNNRVSSIDPNNHETDFVYDTNGNLVAVGQPSVTSIVQGGATTFRPTTFYSYDAHNNLLSVCDASWVHSNGLDWASTAPPAVDNLCPVGTVNTSGNPGPTQYVWSSQSYEPYGELVQETNPTGYVITETYAIAKQGGSVDYGLVTKIQGATVAQSVGAVTPTSSYTYNQVGAMKCFNNGVGTWIAQYKNSAGNTDPMNRESAIADADDGSILDCGKTANSKTVVSYFSYFPNGAVSESQSPLQKARAVGVTYQYDADGNDTQMVHQFGDLPGTTTQWFDGDDRLVETEMPYSPATDPVPDYYSQPWLTRYNYDLTTGGAVSVGSSNPFLAHGNLFKTTEYLPTLWFPPPATNFTWQDIKGTSYDGLDRVTAQFYQVHVGVGSQTYTTDSTQFTYDAPGATGLPASRCDALGICATYSYDALARQSAVAYTDATQTKKYYYDPDGRRAELLVSIDAAKSSFADEAFSYDADGHLVQKVEPNYSTPLGPLSSPAIISYSYLPNGWRSSVSVTSPDFTQSSPPLLSYGYRADGLLANLTFEFAPLDLTYTAGHSFSYIYSAGGRLLSRSDPFTGLLVPNSSPTQTYAATTFAYDSSDEISSETLPNGGSYTITGRDAEGDVKSFTGYALPTQPSAPCGQATVTDKYNRRGELMGRTSTATCNGQLEQIGYQNESANGLIYPATFISGDVTHNSVGLDPVNGRIEQVTNFCGANLANPDTISSFSYDADGRYNGYSWSQCTSNSQPTTSTASISYDAVNRHTTETYGGNLPQNEIGSGDLWCPSASNQQFEMSQRLQAIRASMGRRRNSIRPRRGNVPYTPPGTNFWDTDDHPSQMESIQLNDGRAETLHWDGGNLLFATYPDDNITPPLEDIKIGTEAEIVPVVGGYDVSVIDRDWTGSEVTDHNSSGYDVWANRDPYLNLCTKAYVYGSNQETPSSPTFNTAEFGAFGEPRPDDISDQGGLDGADTINGVRNYEPGLLAFGSPDALGGEPGDPMADRPSTYLRNSPLAFEDPTGLDPAILATIHICAYCHKEDYVGLDPIGAYDEYEAAAAVDVQHGDWVDAGWLRSTADLIQQLGLIDAERQYALAGAASVDDPSAVRSHILSGTWSAATLFPMGGGRKLAGETIYTAAGRAAHALQEYGPGFAKEFRGFAGMRLDAANEVEKIFIELKPNTASGIAAGKAQIVRYLNQLESRGISGWVGQLHLYEP